MLVAEIGDSSLSQRQSVLRPGQAYQSEFCGAWYRKLTSAQQILSTRCLSGTGRIYATRFVDARAVSTVDRHLGHKHPRHRRAWTSFGAPFGIPDTKDAWAAKTPIRTASCRAPSTPSRIAPDLIVISDMCLCEYTDHGHCGIINTPDNEHYSRTCRMATS